jgi:hypothetical protein
MAEENNIYTPPNLVESTAKFGNAEAIAADDIVAHNIQALPDRPNAPTSYGGYSYSARDLKERFEGLARLAINAINTLINELDAETVSNNIKIPEWGGMRNLGALVAAIKSGDLAKAIKVDYVSELGDGDDETTEGEFSPLQQVLTYLTTYVSTLKTDIVDGDLAKAIKVGNGDGGEGKEETFSTLQEALTYLFAFVKDLASDISNGTLADRIMVDFSTDKLTNLQLALNALLSSNKGLASALNTAVADINALKDKVGNEAGVYRPRGTATAIPPDTDDTISVGDVYNIEPEDGGSFIYNEKVFPFGTNMVYLGKDESGKGKWDSLGGIVDYKDITQWDLIITNPTNLSELLSEASGNVLVKLNEPYEGSITLTLSPNLKLLDLGGSKFFGETTITAGNANTAIKNLVAAQEYNNNTANLNGFVKVENCNGIIILSNCDYVTNCSLRSVSSCNYVVNCSTFPESSGDVSFNGCNLISNLKVNSLEDAQATVGVEFKNCHHVSNVHCAEGAVNAIRINYKNCTYVDPYTCAGYVQTENVGKVPVPTAQGGVEFKEFATKDDIGNIEEALRILNEGSATE